MIYEAKPRLDCLKLFQNIRTIRSSSFSIFFLLFVFGTSNLGGCAACRKSLWMAVVKIIIPRRRQVASRSAFFLSWAPSLLSSSHWCVMVAGERGDWRRWRGTIAALAQAFVFRWGWHWDWGGAVFAGRFIHLKSIWKMYVIMCYMMWRTTAWLCFSILMIRVVSRAVSLWEYDWWQRFNACSCATWPGGG